MKPSIVKKILRNLSLALVPAGLILVLFLLSACSSGGGSSPSEGSDWDKMEWDKGKWA